MKRWNIKKLLLYSHHEQMKELEFNLEDVTIITGGSRTGKSAIPEIIDYVMGASECHIPSFARACLSWVGILWVKDDTEFSLFRRIPNIGRKSSEDIYFEIGKNVKIPTKSSVLSKKTNLEGGLSQFERLLGMGDARTESFGTRLESKRLSVRNTMPYLLQDDDVIISKNTLLRGANDERKQSIIESIPYFLGIVDEYTLGKELELKKITKQISRIEKKVKANEAIIYGTPNKALSLIQEAIQLGLIDNDEDIEKCSSDEIFTKLVNITNWDITAQSKVNEDQLPDLYKKLATQQSKAIEIRNQLKKAKQQISVVEEFDGTVNRQKRKLEVINLFKKPHDPSTCPLCRNELTSPSKPVSTIKHLMTKVQDDLKGIEKDRPRLDSHINNLKTELEIRELEIENTKDEIATLVKENEQIKNNLDIFQRRFRTIGRISLYLESKEALDSDKQTKDRKTLEELYYRLEQLEEVVNIESKVNNLENAERRISSIATNIISSLPFEERYKDCPVYINLKNLDVGVSLPTHSESMRDVGSDENYLSLHVSLMLALHRHFANLERPVPGVLLFDQLSRPYFPPDEEPNEVEIDDINESSERSSLLKYFELLFNEVDRNESLQIIIIEHAYFKNHDRYRNSVKYRWKKNESGLIPKDWPEKNK
ncbi:DUF3732 domain-containing protein [Bacillus cabrialesii]|uniref:DUF3732 domain-containing protein n=1 Tax=Bacillus cabrialesii TaxID=2487276 RepID=UPI001C052DEE|nr:DUF3732 domain-containing protein [Bacillus cabrialesii]MBU2659368.1 DUF3732 domain-containing protein [Bacillus cabrialesii]